MHGCHVFGKRALVSKVCLTHRTLILVLQAGQRLAGPLVNLAVAVEAAAGHEPKAADVADEGTAGGVGLNVSVEGVTVGEGAVAHGAAVLVAVLVEGKVLLQLGGLCKSLEAVVAAVWPLTGVGQQVGLEVGGVQESLTTVVTAVGPLQPMNAVVGL